MSLVNSTVTSNNKHADCSKEKQQVTLKIHHCIGWKWYGPNKRDARLLAAESQRPGQEGRRMKAVGGDEGCLSEGEL